MSSLLRQNIQTSSTRYSPEMEHEQKSAGGMAEIYILSFQMNSISLHNLSVSQCRNN